MKRSESIGALAKALAAFNSEVSKIAKNAANPFFKNNYATLDDIIDEVRPLLQKNGLTLMQFPGGDGNTVSVTTYLMHESGEWIESEPLIMKPVKNDPQAVGSCITYARRYSLQAFLSLNTGEDDDGNGATHQKPPSQNKQQNNSQPQGQNGGGNKTITGNQMKALNAAISKVMDAKNLSRDAVIDTLRKKQNIGSFESLSVMTIGQASNAIGELNKVLEGAK